MESPTSVGRNFFFPISWVFLDIDFFLFLNAHVCEVWLQGPFCLSYPLFLGAPEACGKNWESGPGIQRFPPRHPRPELLGLWVNECIFRNWGGWNLDPVSAGSTMFQAPAFIFKMWLRMISTRNRRVEFVPDWPDWVLWKKWRCCLNRWNHGSLYHTKLMTGFWNADSALLCLLWSSDKFWDLPLSGSEWMPLRVGATGLAWGCG